MEDSGAVIEVFTYRSDRLLAEERPQASYLQLVIQGARERGLPADYVAALERVACG
jgi:hypothetical protein